MCISRARNLVSNLLPKSRLYLLRNFEEVATKSDEIVDISLSDLQNILQDDLLNIKDECIAWECAVRWIKYDPEERRKHVPLLLQTVRLGILQTEVINCVFIRKFFFKSETETDFQYFMDKVKQHEYVQDNDEARPIIIKALSFLYELDEIGKREIEVEKIFIWKIGRNHNLFSVVNRFTRHPLPFQEFHKT